jgi:hypothetical protein
MSFTKLLLATLVPAICAAPAFAAHNSSGGQGGSFQNSPHSHPLVAAMYCDSDGSFFTHGGFTRFVNSSGHSIWTGGLTIPVGDGIGVIVNTAGYKANSFQFDIKTTGSPGPTRQLFWYWNDSTGTLVDWANINGTTSDNSSVTGKALSNGTISYTFSGATEGITGLPLVQVGFEDYGIDNGSATSASAFSDTITSILIDGIPAVSNHNNPVDLCFLFLK